ncbi:pyridoxamine 5'-phosphate oxidase family protein [Aureibacillus halotolerans]|uniref:General stress protein 26 n=1 Tax=Aureibacillus halotolerans TaxID=1508390 RepID=A0A4R6TUV7_9BACI|nr:pyridoxamine 5'-phosphate oxidase family protein [Aureibacillus halotolerans]TDQ36412.1 general stress protein 26 [Aureibacillus halotolerans]
MNQQELKKHIMTILDAHQVGTLATINDGKPYTRYMTFFNKAFTLYTPTSKSTHKVDHIEQNPNVHILLGYEGDGYNDSFVEIEAVAEIEEDQETKKSLWNEKLGHYLSGPDDPNYVVIRCKPNSIRYMNAGKETPLELDF